MNGRMLAALAAALVALALHAPILGHGFVWDDAHKFGQARWDGPSDLAAALTPQYWTELSHEPPRAGYYRPVASLLFAFNQSLFGLEPRVYHAESLLLHAGVTALVVLLAATLFHASPTVALAAGLLFAVHPIHTEAVAFASDLTDLLSALPFIGALLVASRARDSWRSAAAIVLLWMLALGAKELAITLPLAIALVWWTRDLPVIRGRRRFWTSALLALLLYLTLRSWIFGDFAAAGAGLGWDGFYPRISAAGRSLTLAARMLIYPWPLIADYGPAGAPEPPHPLPFIVPFLFLVLLAGSARLRARAPELPFALAWFAIALLPVSNLIPIPQPYAERFLYLPSVGPCIALALALDRLRRHHRWSAPAILVPLLAAGALLTARRLPDWRNEGALWSSVVEALPSNPRALQNLGADFERRGDLARAIELYAAAHDLAPRMEKVTTAYATTLHRAGRAQEALDLLIDHEAHNPLTARVAGMLGAAFAGRAEFERALGYFEISSELEPADPAPRISRALCLTSLGRLEEAQLELRRLRDEGVDPDRLETLASALARATKRLESQWVD